MWLYLIASEGIDRMMVMSNKELSLSEKQGLCDQSREAADLRGEMYFSNKFHLPGLQTRISPTLYWMG